MWLHAKHPLNRKIKAPLSTTHNLNTTTSWNQNTYINKSICLQEDLHENTNLCTLNDLQNLKHSHNLARINRGLVSSVSIASLGPSLGPSETCDLSSPLPSKFPNISFSTSSTTCKNHHKTSITLSKENPQFTNTRTSYINYNYQGMTYFDQMCNIL